MESELNNNAGQIANLVREYGYKINAKYRRNNNIFITIFDSPNFGLVTGEITNRESC